MENASKALLIAGAILIAILIISLSVLMYGNIGGTAKEMADMTEQEIASFNSKITPYLGNAVTGTQVNALLQYCLSNNMVATNANETNKLITVKYNGIDRIVGSSTTYERVATGGRTYIVRGTYNNGLLTLIEITG